MNEVFETLSDVLEELRSESGGREYSVQTEDAKKAGQELKKKSRAYEKFLLSQTEKDRKFLESYMEAVDHVHYKEEQRAYYQGIGYLCFKTDVKYPLKRGDIIYHVQDRTAEIREGDSYTDLLLSSVPGIDGISKRMYFHCPYCGRRVRYLYDYYKHYACRKCAKLNYSCQQKSGMEEMRLKMERIVEKKLGYTWWRKDYPDIPIQELWYIPKPPYMRWEKYERIMAEFRQLQKDYERAFWVGLAKISYSRDIVEAAIRHLNSL